MKASFISYLLILFVAIACSSTNKGTDNTSNQLTDPKEEKTNSKTSCNFNESKTFKLCYSYQLEQNTKYLSFFVYDASTEEVIYKGSNAKAVTWVSDSRIKVVNFTRIPTGEGTNDYYIFDLITKKVIKEEN